MKWQEPDRYEWLTRLSVHGLAWEFLRRNPAFGQIERPVPVRRTISSSLSILQTGYDAGAADAFWGLLIYESPDRDARNADIFWHPDVCGSVLPVISSIDTVSVRERYFDIRKLRCNVTILRNRSSQNVLFRNNGRFLQLTVAGDCVMRPVQILANVLPGNSRINTRWRSLRRLDDLVRTKALRSEMYPPAMCAWRLSRVLQALDGHLVGASQREIAVALFGVDRVEEDWAHPGAHLRDQVRRTIKRGRDLMNGGYLKLLR
ncbi:MAG: DUF2285 domain-containing protein [Parvibaculum sp.]|nr:DUF2285 domain-containing protein [Parvibaculum sp.]